MKRCYICGKETEKAFYHKKCCSKLFNSSVSPTIEYTWEELNSLAAKVINQHISVPGVQPKLSLHIEKNAGNSGRLTIVGFEGSYILKPPPEQYPKMPEAEHFCMMLASLCGIKTALFGLIPLKSGELAYITKRMDRTGEDSLHMEDFCQLTNKLTEGKYRGSMEQVGKTVRKYSSIPGLDAIRLFEITLFSFFTGNSDMHLKNFSLLRYPGGNYQMAPAYDLLPVKIILPEDLEELALTLNGKKRKFNVSDFEVFGQHLMLTDIQIRNAFRRITENITENLAESIKRSFLTDQTKEAVTDLILERVERIK